VATAAAAAALGDVGDAVTFASDAYDAVRDADALVIMTEWNEFRGLDLARIHGAMAAPVVIDARNVLDPAQTRDAGFRYVGTGRSVPAATEVVA
jgi:UDPglucose 6-dehydrogenase